MNEQKKILEIIANHLGLTPADLDPTASLKEDLGLNPVEIADLFHRLTNEFQISFDAEEIAEVETIGDLLNMTEDKLLDK